MIEALVKIIDSVFTFNTLAVIAVNLDFVVSIKASSIELESIMKAFCINPDAHPIDKRYTIPFSPKAPSMVWYGDTAKTIISTMINFVV